MEIQQLRCFVAVAETMHFGRAAQNLNMLPASFGRHIKLLEQSTGVQLLSRTTRTVTLTENGSLFLKEARELVERVDNLTTQFRTINSDPATPLRVGVIDSAAAGLIPQLLPLFQQSSPNVAIELLEQKTIRLIPKILSGRLDIAIVRPSVLLNSRLTHTPLLVETPVVAVPAKHELSNRKQLTVFDMEDIPLIVPDPRSRPQSHALSMNIFIENGLTARVVQIADEKHTIVNLVNSGIGLAIVPRWTARLKAAGVRFIPLKMDSQNDRQELSLSACWLRDARDPVRDSFMKVLIDNLSTFADSA